MFDGPITPRSGPPRLAIISTYDDMCGIAGYTRALEQQLRPHADIKVFDLDQFLLRSPHARVQRLADEHIRNIAAGLHAFDNVNFQLEYGTLGRTARQILRRLRVLVRAAPAVSVTFHTMLGIEGFDWPRFAGKLVKGRLLAASQVVTAHYHNRKLAARVYRFLRHRQRKQQIQAIVHNRRDARMLRDVFRIENVSHHPLSFISPDQADQIRLSTRRAVFPILGTLPDGAKLIGTFGFLSPYKGFETALRALHYLPDDYHLLIFGGIHPQGIQKHITLDPYIKILLDEAHIGQTALDILNENETPATLNLDDGSRDLLLRHPADLQQRVHFMGVHSDEGFTRAMALCDAVVLPYMEVGQSSSGPIALALEMGCRVIASRTQAFLQYARYHPNQIEFFDIGNFAELAGLIRAEPPSPTRDRVLSYNTDTNTALYLAANRPGETRSQLRPGAAKTNPTRPATATEVVL